MHIGDAHATAVVLYLDADSAWALAGWIPHEDAAKRELEEAIMRWEAVRDAA